MMITPSSPVVGSATAQYYTREQFLARVPGNGGDAEQCNCMAHSAVFSTEYPSDVVADLKDLIRTPPEIMTQDVGIRFIMALLQRLFHYFDMGTLEVAPAGYSYDVSYVLLHKQKRYHFFGHPDFVILEDCYGARQILISTGEIQSTSDPDMQNSTYAVGSFLTRRTRQDTKPIICVNLFKEKWCSLAIARMDRGSGPPNSVGKVSLKYYISPSPINLKRNLRTFANRLYCLLKYIEEQ